tara:strand:+ start:26415 stop:27551 length:1137 start_codon:yes stop_codon:yes gene_type:complete
MTIPQLIPTTLKESKHLISQIFDDPSLFASQKYSSLCEKWLSDNLFNRRPVFLTTSGTRALELIAASMNLEKDDEIIFPSYTFVGTANPFVLFGVKPVFVDVMEDTLGMDFNLLEDAITKNTKAIVVVHYNGIGAHIDQILRIAQRHKILLIEDNAQGFMCTYKDQFLGTFGDFSILSFNYTKNIQCGEGGALIVNNDKYLEKVQYMYHLGTNRLDFLNKKISNYEWVSKGSKFYPSQLESAMLLPQLINCKKILSERLSAWKLYYTLLSKNKVIIENVDLPVHFADCEHTAHIFYIRTKNLLDKTGLISFLKKRGISAYSHYTPLHLSKYGKKHGICIAGHVSEKINNSLIRLPLYSKITANEINMVVDSIEAYFSQ